jgi:hypothetical protein
MAAVPAAYEHGRLFLSAGAGTPFPFRLNNLTFGMATAMPNYVGRWLDSVRAAAQAIDSIAPRQLDLSSLFNATSAAHATEFYTAHGDVTVDTVLPPSTCDATAATCFASLRVGFIQEQPAGFTGALCGFAPTAAEARGFALAGAPVTLPSPWTNASVEHALTMLRGRGANIVLGCTYIASGRALIDGLHRLRWAPYALLISQSVGQPPYNQAINNGTSASRQTGFYALMTRAVVGREERCICFELAARQAGGRGTTPSVMSTGMRRSWGKEVTSRT